MKIFMFVICFALLVVGMAVAGPMTWSTPVPNATDTNYYGTNAILTRQAAATAETRARIQKLGIFAGYTSQGN
jgi:hypothetical protein